MDKILPKKSIWKRRALWGVVLGVALAAVYGAWIGGSSKTLALSRQKTALGAVVLGEFQDYLTLEAVAQPLAAVSLDAIEGGRIEKKFVEAGARVELNQPLLLFSNPDLERDLLLRKEQFLNEKSALQTAKIASEDRILSARTQLLEVENQIFSAKRKYITDSSLFSRRYVSENEYENSKAQFTFLVQKKALLEEKVRQETRSSAIETAQKQENVGLKRENLGLAEAAVGRLTVSAPVSGVLTELNAEIGELKTRGAPLGKIDRAQGYLLRAPTDEFYLARVRVGQTASVEIDGKTYDLTVSKIYPRVSGGRFEVELTFNGAQPPGLQTGRSAPTRLKLGQNAQALLLPRGDYYTANGGNYLFVLSSDGKTAQKRKIQVGRQNADYFEVISGLNPGEKAVLFGYDGYKEYDILSLKD